MSLRQLKFKPKIQVPISKQRTEEIKERKLISDNVQSATELACHAQVKVEPKSIIECIPTQLQVESNIQPSNVKQNVESVENKKFNPAGQGVVEQSCKNEGKASLYTSDSTQGKNSFLLRKSNFKPRIQINSKVINSTSSSKIVESDKREDTNKKILENTESSFQNRDEFNLSTVSLNPQALSLPKSNVETEVPENFNNKTTSENNVNTSKIECNNFTDDSSKEKKLLNYSNTSPLNKFLDVDKSEFNAINNNSQSHSSTNENNILISFENENELALTDQCNENVHKSKTIDGISSLTKFKSNNPKANALFRTKSVRTGHHLGDPFKPKLTNRAKPKFGVSTFRKMNIEVKKNFLKKYGNKEPNPSELTLMETLFCNPSLKHGLKGQELETNNSDNGINSTRNKKPDEEVICNRTDNIPNYRNNSNDNDVPVPQLKVSSDGKLIIAPESLVVEHSLKEIISDSDNSGFSRRKKKGKKGDPNAWSHEETMKFYKALNSIGADFSMMQFVFPNRSRNNIKNKFKKEERIHGNLIAKVLSKPSEFHLKEVLREIDLDEKFEKAVATNGRSLQRPKPKIRCNSFVKLLSGKSSSKFHEDGTPQSKNESDKVMFVHYLNGEKKMTEEERKKRAKEMRTLRKLKKNPNQNSTDFVRIFKKLEEEGTSENHEHKTSISSSDISECINTNEMKCMNTNEDHIKISTNIEYDNVKYTQSITYNPSNLENPIEINETISHEKDSLFNQGESGNNS